MAHQFSLADEEGGDSDSTDSEGARTSSADPNDDADLDTSPSPADGQAKRSVRRARPLGERSPERDGQRGHAGDDNRIPTRVKEVQERLKETFHLPVNKDVVVREFSVGPDQWPAVAVFIDGMASTLIVNESILEPLMVLTADDLFGSQAAVDGAAQARAGAAPPAQGRESFGRPAQFGDKPPLRPLPDRMDRVVQTLLPSNQVSVVDTWSGAVDGILTGSTAVFVEGTERAVIAESKGWEHRSVSLPQTESVVKGPHQAFTESFRANTALIRALLRSADLVTEMMSVGRLGKTDVAIMYMHGLTNERLVAEVKRRIEAVDVDYLADSGTLQQFIEDDPRVWLPQSLSTERPDRVAQMLTEGYVAILVGQSTFVLVVPVVFWTLMQSAEDAYVRYPFGSFLRGIRWVALAAALLVPSLYLAVTNYHPEMIPTDLMMAIAGSREQVPFPAIVEILIMEFAIELIREAGIRIPSIIGPTIGIVGALIIGQAAVQAGIVSPLLVIVIAVTALASFSIPTYNLQFGVRIMRFVFLLVAAMFGFYGLALAIVAMIARLSVQKSFGVPLFAPVAPKMDSAPDVFARGPAYAMNQRPLFLYTQKSWRQQPYTRPWSALSARRQNTIRTREQRQDSNSFSPPGRAGRNGGGNNGGRSSE